MLSSSSSSSSKDLPIEIVIEILSRLPVKTLIQFTSVCKSWYALIKNPNFITSHLNRSISHANNNNNKGYLLVMPWKFKPSRSKYISFVLCSNTFVEHDKLEFPSCSRTMSVLIVNSCNGLICLTERYPNASGRVVYLWNLSIRKYKALPFTLSLREVIVCKRIVGFGYDRRTNDYKVVRILYFKEEIPPEIEVYSLSTDYWRRIGATVDFIAHRSLAPVPFVNGAIHWMAEVYILDNLRNSTVVKYDFIVAFSIGDEVFRKIGLPVNCLDGDGVDVSLMDFKELLSLFVYFPYEDYGVERCYIWVMSEYGVTESWSKHFTIILSSPREIRRPLGFTKNGKLMFENDDKEMVLLDLENLQVRDLGFGVYSHAVDASYMESLVLLEERNADLVLAN